MSANSEDLLFTVTTASAQDILIITSAGFSFVKSLMAVGTYSYFHVIFALLELTCSGLAFAVFLVVDYQEEGREEIYGDDVMIYLLTFVSGIILEWMDLLVTYQTVRTYKRLKKIKPRSITEKTKKRASGTYKFMLVFSLVTCAIVPLIAFSKAGWETDYFAPTEFTAGNGRLLLYAIIITIVCQGISALLTTLNATNPEGFVKALGLAGLVLYLPVLASQILVYIVLSRVSGQEAGGLTYLTLINAMQAVESTCEISRHMTWFQSEHPPKDDPDAEKSLDEQIAVLFRKFDEENTGYVTVPAMRVLLESMEEEGMLKDGAAEWIVNQEKIDYTSTIQTMLSRAGDLFVLNES